MANIKSAKKRIKTTEKKTLQNHMFISEMKTAIKKYDKALVDGNQELAMETYKSAVKIIDRAVAKGYLNKNNAARKKSRFTKKLNSLGA
ncbi:30S ribosomal protein S20 [bioreactor metagenome]|uniref:30S ribosomal protein S20 n=1 Tax=bioreactor metagenome TaxID=1076179 RepID=A0A645CCL8_9ZZZZ|nr:30S ribosomal protein S20 [Oscillospiraceae bacterium]